MTFFGQYRRLLFGSKISKSWLFFHFRDQLTFLQPFAQVSAVLLHPRKVCCRSRMRYFEIRVGNDSVTDSTSDEVKAGKAMFTGNALCAERRSTKRLADVFLGECVNGSITGRYVTVQKDLTYVNNLEVEELDFLVYEGVEGAHFTEFFFGGGKS